MADPSLLLVAAFAALLLAVLGFGLLALYRRVRQDRELGKAREDLRRLQQEAAEEEYRRRQARMTHELKAPIHALLGMTDLLAESDLDSTQAEQVQTLRTSAELLLALVRDILDLERLEAGALRIRQEEFPLRHLVAETVELLRPEAEARGIELRSEIAADLPQCLLGDPIRIRQILLNLLSNAVKFTPAGADGRRAEVLVLVDQPEDGEGERWRCAVIDPGVGMTQATAARLFQPFSQADTTLVRTSEGNGLGLAISHHLVAAMGGHIGCKSVRGKGSTFHFSLPLKAAAAAGVTVSEAPPERFRGRVLVVDDEAVSRRIARAHLEVLGVEVVEADGSAAALEGLSKESFDLMLTDLKMPNLDGLGLARRRRSLEQATGLERLTLVAVTAQGEEAWEEERRAGFDGRLSKPFRRSELATLLRRWLPEEKKDHGERRENTPIRSWQETRAALVALGKKTGEDEVAKAVAAFKESSIRHLEVIETAWRAGEPETVLDHLHGLSGSAEFLGGIGVVATAGAIRQQVEGLRPVDEDLLLQLRRKVVRDAETFDAGRRR